MDGQESSSCCNQFSMRGLHESVWEGGWNWQSATERTRHRACLMQSTISVICKDYLMHKKKQKNKCEQIIIHQRPHFHYSGAKFKTRENLIFYLIVPLKPLKVLMEVQHCCNYNWQVGTCSQMWVRLPADAKKAKLPVFLLVCCLHCTINSKARGQYGFTSTML